MKFFHQCIIWANVLFFPLLSFSQEISFKDADSLLTIYQKLPENPEKVRVLHYLYQAYQYNDIEKAKIYINEALVLAKKIDDQVGIARAFYGLGSYYYRNSALDSATYYYEKSLALYTQLKLPDDQAKVNHSLALLLMPVGDYEKALKMLDENIELYQTQIPDSLRLGVTYSVKAVIHIQKGNLNIALTNAMKSLGILEKLDNPIRIADTKKTLGGIEMGLGNHDKSLAYYLEALEIYRAHDDKFYEAIVMNSIGQAYYGLKEYEKGIEYLEPCLTLTREMKDVTQESSVLLQLGRTYRELGQFQKAISLLLESLTLVKKSRSQSKIVETYIAIGKTFHQYEKPVQAITYFDHAIELADSFEFKPHLYEGYKHRARAYASLNNYKMAYQDYLKYTIVSDSIFNRDKSQQIEELRAIYDTEKKEQQIIQQETEIALLEQQEKVSRLQKILLGTSLGLLLLALGWGYYGFRQRMKKAALEKEKIDLELTYKKKELTTHALRLAKKNETLEKLKQKARELKADESGKAGYQQLISAINFDLKDENSWENFARRFQEVHHDFYARVAEKYPDVTPNELRLMALLKMNLSSKEIANILNISLPGVKKARQRLRKKMDLSSQDSLENAVMDI
ncbi:MAG: transcriptional regulator [Bacteroidia bacterium]